MTTVSQFGRSSLNVLGRRVFIQKINGQGSRVESVLKIILFCHWPAGGKGPEGT